MVELAASKVADCTAFDPSGNINMLWSAPLQMAIAVTMLWFALGPCVCGGLAVMLLLIPLQVLASHRLPGP